MLLRVLNPNPKALAITRRGLLIQSLRSKEEVEVLFDTELRLAYAGKRAIVVLEATGEPWESYEQWAQEIGSEPTAPDPEKAILEGGTIPA